MEHLFKRQSEIIRNIEKICVNFSKDGPTRKTKEYIEKRLLALDSLWGEFESNNERLSADEERTHEYFTKSIYVYMKSFFETERKKIAEYPVHSTSSAAAEDSDSEENKFYVPISNTEPQFNTGRIIDDLLTQQRTNFRAFSRIVDRALMDSLEEKWEIEDQLKELQRRWRVIDEQHLRIDNYLQGQDKRYEQEFLINEQKFHNIKKQLNQKLNSTSCLQQSTPKVEIPVFTGKFSQWPTFFDLFKETIHNNKSLNNAQKLQHLKGKLKGEAERLIQHLTISSHNYDTAWDILTHRYNNVHALFTFQIETFLNQPNVSKQSSYELKRLHDTTMETIHAIHNLGVDTSTWDPLLVHLISKKLDTETYKDYKEARRAPRELPAFDELMTFIESKFVALEPINKRERDTLENKTTPSCQTSRAPHFKPSYQNRNRFGKSYQAAPTFTKRCPHCKSEHDLWQCKRFHNLPSEDKIKILTRQQICRNCLYKHIDKSCVSTNRCKYCNGEHNTMIHDDLMNVRNKQPSSSQLGASTSRSSSPPALTMQPRSTSNNTPKLPGNKELNVNYVAAEDEEILLTTLLLKIKTGDETYITLRALLDQGSQISLISEHAAQTLGLQRQRYNACVSGIGVSSKVSRGIVTLECESIYGDYNFTTQALVISKVINQLPNASFKKSAWPHLRNINLADPEYNVSKPIDLLLDANVYSDIIMSGLIKGSPQAPIAQQTKLGWILSGSVKTFNCSVVLNDIGDLSRFWEVEDINQSPQPLTEAEEYCEKFYAETTRRLDCGRYEVALPMKQGFEQNLGTSKSKAILQFKQLEKRMTNNPSLSSAYHNFMDEYETLRHMRPADRHTARPTCYLPHHGVLKMDSTTTKLRVVFNASAKTSTGQSLNDLMECGPNLQQDLQALILKWRTHKYVVTADIQMMFRQFLVREIDQPLQSIVWRASPQDHLQEYHLTTVTYGTKAAPFLAMRTLRQIARDNVDKYPLAADSLENCFYTDDILTGHDSMQQIQQLQTQLIAVLKSAGLNLRKWSSNHPELVKNLPSDKTNVPFEFKDAESRKTLGLRWNPSSDTFTFEFNCMESQGSHTKRQFLSDISKIYDPLGWLSPITIKAKLLFQRTWLLDLKWDDNLPSDILTEWQQLRNDLKTIKNICIPRYLGDNKPYKIHGFCDASEKAYACSIYAVAQNDKGEFTSRLIAAKTKVAPQSKPLSLPRLELLGALLLSQLMNKVINSITTGNISMYAWTDSMVVLGWLHGDTSRWKQFVANRVRQITEIIPASHWRHVKSEDNAADYATRGLTVINMQQKLWWEGPQWLITFDSHDTIPVKFENPKIEMKKKHVNAALHENHQNNFIMQLLQDCSSLTRVTHIVGWVLRFLTQLRNRQVASKNATTSTNKYVLSTTEIECAKYCIIKTVQAVEFQDDIYKLRKNGHVRINSKISCLNPFLDEQGILRVGGRLNNAKINYAAKHPILLPPKHRLTILVIQQSHITTLHGGPKLTLSHIRLNYWIPSGVCTVKKQVRLCIKCRRYSQDTKRQIMADLPTPRVTPARPFTHCGVDFTGHLDIKANKGRGIKTTKGYVAVFVCLATKAVHLELVTDLSTAAFLAAFRRMCARRGTPRHMYSDNGTNFVGASRVLKKEYKAIIETLDINFEKNIKDMAVTWHYNVALWPSGGGLWEAAVKSMKYHLKRVLGGQKLTYEEFTTLLYQIEACMNSRPLCPLNESLEEDGILTPGHFLIGDSLLSRPQTEIENINLPARWHLIQSMNKAFWKRWSLEYLQQLQSRSKWRTPEKDLQINDIVIIKEDNLPPGKWAMGRVCELHPGKDGHVRVVTLKTHKNVIKRPITRLIVLPVYDDTQPNDSQTSTRSPDDVSSKRSRRPQKTHSCLHFMSMALLLLMTMITPSVQETAKALPFNVTAIQTHQSLYFDRIAELQHIRDEWRLIIYYNMSSYWDGVSSIKYKYLDHIRTMCHDEYAHYEGVVLQLEQEMQEIKHYNGLLEKQNNRRQKRGLINGVGYIANSLFGVLDERFAEQYREDIEKITQNEGHLQNLIKNQTSIIESQYNILHQNEKTMNSQLTSINQHLANISRKISNLRSDAENNAYITTSILAINIIVSNLRRIQERIINTLMDIYHGRIDAHLLPPEQLEEQISIIQGQLHGDLTLPVDKYNVQQLYKLMKTRARIHKDYLMIEVKIPLISNEIYELDQIITIPLQREDKMQYTTPTYPYIAFNIHRDSGFLLSEIDVQSCLHMQNKVICSIDRPIYVLTSKQSICDIKLLHTEKYASSLCAVQLSPCAADKWIKLHRQNSWLYSCCKQCNIRIYCTAGMEMTTLLGNGIINLGQGCTVKGETFTIFSHQNYLSHMEGHPDEIEFPEPSLLNAIINTSVTIDNVPLQETDPEIWNHMKAQIDQLKVASSEQINVHDVHHYVLQYMLLTGLAAVIVVSVFLWRRHRRAPHETAAPPGSPAPPRAAARRSLQQDSVAPKFDP